MSASDEIKRVNRSGDDYYKILGVEKDANDDAIKKAYRKLALRLHPDKCSESGAEEAFKRVGEAFGTLSDPQKRKTYDVGGVEGLQRGGGGGPGVSPEDLFEAFFGGMAGGGMGGPGVHFARGGPGGFGGAQTFRFSTAPGGGGIFFTSSGFGPGFGGPGFPGGSASSASRPRRRPAEDADEQPQQPDDISKFLTKIKPVLDVLGPMQGFLLPPLLLGGLMLFFLFIQFVLQRFMFIAPVMYLTEGKTRWVLLGSIFVASLAGVI
mmetsp:Transcript_49586/g.105520  ORF Transcript_49586/g.105520 Transcript_49586/m.105520 type:complete len:265 (+) Transcript_49586:116-910(+)